MLLALLYTRYIILIGKLLFEHNIPLYNTPLFNESTIIYPSKISPKATPQTLWFFILMVLITTFHGFIQSHHLLNVHTVNVSYATYFGKLFFDIVQTSQKNAFDVFF